ncbi:MAG: hypothetical protein FWE34_04645 [Defluviitaleaceae bacterium]|nr:hypothetical protein [Defluviitaleaceae bacterium]
MTKKSSINWVMLLFSLLVAIGVFLIGEVLLGFLSFLPFFLQTAIYLTLATILCFLGIFLSEKIHSGYYIPRGRVTFNSTCAKAAGILIPCAFVLGLLTQLLYGFMGATEGEVEAQWQDLGGGSGYAYVYDGVGWWNTRPPGPGNFTIGGMGREYAYESLEDFFSENHDNLHYHLNNFASRNDVLGSDATFAQWLNQRHPTVPSGAPSFLAIANGNVPLAFRNAMEYAYSTVLDTANATWDPQDAYVATWQFGIRDGYTGVHGREYQLLLDALDEWTLQNGDACQNFYSFWAMHIQPDPQPLAPVLSALVMESPHLLLTHAGPGQTDVLRIVLQSVMLSLWGIFLGVAVMIFLNNNKLMTSFLIPRIAVSIVISVSFALLLAYTSMDLSLAARGLLALGTCLLFLPTFSWDINTYAARY